jgi:hypothetical protein
MNQPAIEHTNLPATGRKKVRALLLDVPEDLAEPHLAKGRLKRVAGGAGSREGPQPSTVPQQ